MTHNVQRVHLHSTRLFPNPSAPYGVHLGGVAERCHFFLNPANKQKPVVQLRPCDEPPLVLFLCCHKLLDALQFIRKWSECVKRQFILVSGSSDATLPRQVDARYPSFGFAERRLISEIINCPNLLHWFAENLDEGGHPKLSPLPLGMVFPCGAPRDGSIVPSVPRLADRQPRVFCAHRHREGPQWLLRRRVSALAKGPWLDFCTEPDSELSKAEFMAEIEQYSFVICAEGGGLDPSPKAWSALLHGAIPIIHATALAPAYAHLPVAMIDEWRENALTRKKLAEWRDALLPWFDIPDKRQEVIRRLSSDYWWEIIAAGRPVEPAFRLAVK